MVRSGAAWVLEDSKPSEEADSEIADANSRDPKISRMTSGKYSERTSATNSDDEDEYDAEAGVRLHLKGENISRTWVI